MDLSEKEFEKFVKNAKKDGVELKTEEEYRQMHSDLYALAGIAHRVKNWYEIATDTFEKLTYAGEKFKDGDIATKKDILLAIGQNPKLMDKRLVITTNEWLIPVANNAKRIRGQLDKVRTMPQQMQKASEEAIISDWCRERDSNPRRLSQMIYSHPCLTASLSLQIYGADDRT